MVNKWSEMNQNYKASYFAALGKLYEGLKDERKHVEAISELQDQTSKEEKHKGSSWGARTVYFHSLAA